MVSGGCLVGVELQDLRPLLALFTGQFLIWMQVVRAVLAKGKSGGHGTLFHRREQS